jgi:hypothetical protein
MRAPQDEVLLMPFSIMARHRAGAISMTKRDVLVDKAKN